MNKELYEVLPPKEINRDIAVTATVPGSKSITNRALLLAAMAGGKSRLYGCLTSDDAKHFLDCIKTLGFPVEETPDGAIGSNITITGFDGEVPSKSAEIYVGSAGTAARFLAAMLAFSDGEYILNSSEQMKKRPMQPLIDTLRSIGATVECLENEGHFPLRIVGVKDKSDLPRSITVNIDKSSQFLSALLIAAGATGHSMEITACGSHGLSYVDITASMMKSFGVSVQKQDTDGVIKYVIAAQSGYKATDYAIEPDMSAAAYFYALAALLGAKVAVKGVSLDMLQGDVKFLDVLRKMGCETVKTDDGIAVYGPADCKLIGGFTIDMSHFSDQALTLASIAPFADAPITIKGIAHIRLQECDRIKAMTDALSVLGIKTDEQSDCVTIYPGIPTGGVVETYDDHRVAMSFALTGLRAQGVKISDPMCCKKTFSQYFEVLENVIAQLEKNR